MKRGQKLQYIGKGFIGFHPHFTEMTFIHKEGEMIRSGWCAYSCGKEDLFKKWAKLRAKAYRELFTRPNFCA